MIGKTILKGKYMDLPLQTQKTHNWKSNKTKIIKNHVGVETWFNPHTINWKVI